MAMKLKTLIPLVVIALQNSNTVKALSVGRLLNATSGTSVSGKSSCVSGTLNISATAQNKEILWSGPRDSIETTHFLQETAHVGSSVIQRLSGGRVNITGTYGIYVKLCFPSDEAVTQKVKAIQLLTHGATLDHSYWDITSGYSHVDAAAEAGFATLSYDRLGIGRSDHPDPIMVVQAPMHAEIAHQLVQWLREGGYKDHAFNQVIGVGHSYGSWFTQAVVGKYPRDFDAVILTGTSTFFDYFHIVHAALGLQMANLDPSGKFTELQNGYLTPTPAMNVFQYDFYYYPHFEEEVLISHFESRQTVTIGEILTGAECAVPSIDYVGPIDVVTGQYDFCFCAGNCHHRDGLISGVQPLFFPAAGKGSQSFTVPNVGHNINGHHGASIAFSHMHSFLKANEIGGLISTIHEHSEL